MHPDLLNNPAFLRYYEAWQQNPASLVFAPIAEFYCHYKLYADARRICEAGVRANPQSVIAHYTMARIYVSTREWHAARHEAQWVLAQAPRHEGALAVLQKVNQALIVPVPKVVRPLTIVRDAPAVPKEREPQVATPVVLTQAPEPENFETTVIMKAPKKRRTTVLKPAPWHTVTMAKIYAQQGHFVKARTIYKTILNMDPENNEAQTGLATVERKMRDAANS